MKRIHSSNAPKDEWTYLAVPPIPEVPHEGILIDWCDQFCSTGQYCYAFLGFQDCFWFEEVADAVAFKLRFPWAENR